MHATPAIAVRGLRVIRGGRLVLDGISLEVPRGSITGLLGPSGCGKTTLMRAVVGVQRVAGGEVTVLGRPAGASELRRRVAYVTQAPSVYGDLTVRENLRYFARVVGADPARIDDAIAAVGLETSADRPVGRMSGGQRTRASLAAAMVGEPELLVLDEPTVGLDPVLRHELWGRLRGLAGAGATLLVSSHVMDEAERCDRLVLMRDGAVLAEETPASLLARTGASDVEEAFLRLVEPRTPEVVA